MSDTEGTKEKAKTSYPMTKVDALPDNAPVGRANFYLGLLDKIATDPGEWYEVAYFQTPTGAKSALKALQSGARAIPAGEWEFETRRVANPADAAGPKHSKLYARFLG